MKKIAILGAGNIGQAICRGLIRSGRVKPEHIMLTNTDLSLIEPWRENGCSVTDNNAEAAAFASVLIICVEPQQTDRLLEQIRSSVVENKHVLISVVSGVPIDKIRQKLNCGVPVVRAMPNTAIAIGESITALASRDEDKKFLPLAVDIFSHVGETIILREDLIRASTSLGSCGIAFFMRAIRAAVQGGIEIGLHAEDAKKIATQTAKGAAMLLISGGNHPEFEIDKVTTPLGVTISGLNQMEHAGFSSAMIRGIVTAWEKTEHLY